MKLIGMMPVRNEACCLGLSLRVVLLWCDEVVVLLHACTDDSERIARDVLRESPGRVTILRDMDGTWNEMPHRQRMLEVARDRGATHLAIVDADEVMSGELLNSCWDKWLHLMPTGSILQLPGYNLRHGINQYHDNGVWGNRWLSTAFADHPELSWKGNIFHHREPFWDASGPHRLEAMALNPYRPIQQAQGGVMHLWGASERRLMAKHALYKATEHIRKMNAIERIERTYNDWRSPEDNLKHWPSQTEWGKPWTFASVPESWWAPYAHLMKYLDIDAEPWQEAEVWRLVEKHGREMFAGLDLFGLA